jgi:predicted AlkP superfamily phosphohydrolase/phosphomutase
MPASSQTPPLVVLGFDVGDPALLRRWASEGHLPTLAAILERGVSGVTDGPDLTFEHGIWTSVFSGVSAARHGYYYFRQLKPDSYELHTRTGQDALATPFWAGLRDRSVAIVDAPDVTPRAGLRGVQISDWAVHNAPFPPACEPAGLIGELERTAGPSERIDEALRSTPREDEAIFRRLLARV